MSHSVSPPIKGVTEARSKQHEEYALVLHRRDCSILKGRANFKTGEKKPKTKVPDEREGPV